MPVVSATPHAPLRGDANVALSPKKDCQGNPSRKGSPVKDAGNVMCAAMAAAVVALARYETLRCTERALVARRAFALLHT